MAKKSMRRSRASRRAGARRSRRGGLSPLSPAKYDIGQIRHLKLNPQMQQQAIAAIKANPQAVMSFKQIAQNQGAKAALSSLQGGSRRSLRSRYGGQSPEVIRQMNATLPTSPPATEQQMNTFQQQNNSMYSR